MFISSELRRAVDLDRGSVLFRDSLYLIIAKQVAEGWRESDYSRYSDIKSLV